MITMVSVADIIRTISDDKTLSLFKAVAENISSTIGWLVMIFVWAV